jgi:hypothetical protein
MEDSAYPDLSARLYEIMIVIEGCAQQAPHIPLPLGEGRREETGHGARDDHSSAWPGCPER